jgi:hypothetical protein
LQLPVAAAATAAVVEAAVSAALLLILVLPLLFLLLLLLLVHWKQTHAHDAHKPNHNNNDNTIENCTKHDINRNNHKTSNSAHTTTTTTAATTTATTTRPPSQTQQLQHLCIHIRTHTYTPQLQNPKAKSMLPGTPGSLAALVQLLSWMLLPLLLQPCGCATHIQRCPPT